MLFNNAKIKLLQYINTETEGFCTIAMCKQTIVMNLHYFVNINKNRKAVLMYSKSVVLVMEKFASLY